MKKFIALGAALLIAFALVGCDSDPPAEAEPAEPEATEEAEAPQEEAEEELEEVEVAADGTEFDPPIQPEQLPDGVYYCDMGTTHYARGENSEVRCPLCNMMLTKKGGEPAGHDHDHDHHGHDHDHDH